MDPTIPFWLVVAVLMPLWAGAAALIVVAGVQIVRIRLDAIEHDARVLERQRASEFRLQMIAAEQRKQALLEEAQEVDERQVRLSEAVARSAGIAPPSGGTAEVRLLRDEEGGG